MKTSFFILWVFLALFLFVGIGFKNTQIAVSMAIYNTAMFFIYFTFVKHDKP